MNRRFEFILIAVLCTLFISPILYRPLAESKQLLIQGRDLLSKGQLEKGAELLGDAVMWRAPFNSSAKVASQELSKISSDETLPADARALARAHLLRGLASSRSWMWKLSSFWQQIDYQRLEEQVIADKVGAAPRVTTTHPPPRVDFMWQGVSHLCFAIWVGSLFAVIWRCLDRSGRLLSGKKTRFFVLTGIACFSFLMWLVALSRA